MTPGGLLVALLAAGADPDARADLYGQPCGVLSLLVSSRHPAAAGVQGELVRLLVEAGASIEGHGERWGTPLMTSLLFDCPDATEALLGCGAATDDAAPPTRPPEPVMVRRPFSFSRFYKE